MESPELTEFQKRHRKLKKESVVKRQFQNQNQPKSILTTWSSILSTWIPEIYSAYWEYWKELNATHVSEFLMNFTILKNNSNTIELTVHTSCYWVLDLSVLNIIGSSLMNLYNNMPSARFLLFLTTRGRAFWDPRA